MRKVKFLGKMPDPFQKPDGTRMTADEWWKNRATLRDFVVDFEYGGMPPRPEVVEFDLLNRPYMRGSSFWYKVTAGTREKQISFMLELNVPPLTEPTKCGDPYFEPDERFPVILTGDACYHNMESDTIAEANRRGYIAARFNRLELCKDRSDKNWRTGGLHEVYPEMDFTAISAWAWGYLVCMDVFEKLPFVDETEVGITGHSRGGKTVLLAATVDERIKYVCPNNSGCHGAVSYRTIAYEQGEIKRPTERLGNMLDSLPSWMGPKLTPYRDREQDLPYDMHYFGALIAPRYYIQFEGMQDYWINPIGAWQNFMAVKECYRYLGCEDHAAAWFRPGVHRHKLPDFTEFMDFMDRARAGLPLREHYGLNPYPEFVKNFDW